MWVGFAGGQHGCKGSPAEHDLHVECVLLDLSRMVSVSQKQIVKGNAGHSNDFANAGITRGNCALTEVEKKQWDGKMPYVLSGPTSCSPSLLANG